jgi:hypothetical protein
VILRRWPRGRFVSTSPTARRSTFGQAFLPDGEVVRGTAAFIDEGRMLAFRFEAVVSADHDLISGRWEKRTGRGVWEHDFAVTYRRAA